MKVKNGTTAPPVATIDTNQGSQKVGSELSCRNLCNGSDSQTDDTDPLLLHKSVFHNDIKSVFKLTQIPDCDINAKDKHGEFLAQIISRLYFYLLIDYFIFSLLISLFFHY